MKPRLEREHEAPDQKAVLRSDDRDDRDPRRIRLVHHRLLLLIARRADLTACDVARAAVAGRRALPRTPDPLRERALALSAENVRSFRRDAELIPRLPAHRPLQPELAALRAFGHLVFGQRDHDAPVRVDELARPDRRDERRVARVHLLGPERRVLAAHGVPRAAVVERADRSRATRRARDHVLNGSERSFRSSRSIRALCLPHAATNASPRIVTVPRVLAPHVRKTT